MKLILRLCLCLALVFTGVFGLSAGSGALDIGFSPVKTLEKSGIARVVHTPHHSSSINVFPPPLNSDNEQICIEEYEEENDKLTALTKAVAKSNYFTSYYSAIPGHLTALTAGMFARDERKFSPLPERYLLFGSFRI